MKVVKQEGVKDCGVCCLLSIIRHFDGDVSLEYLRELTKTTKDGVSAYNLVSTAKHLGFNSYGLNTNITEIKEDMLPIIAHVFISKTYQHFIVIYQIKKSKKEMLIMDPATGKRKITFAEFNLMTTNNYIYLKPTKKILKLEKKKIIKDWLKLFLKNNKKYIPYIIILTIIYFILNIISAFYFKLILNKAINYSIVENVFIISKIIVITYILKEIIFYIKNLNLLKYSQILDEELTKNVFKRLMFLPYLYYKNRTVGEVISRMKDLNTVKSFITKIISSFTTDLFQVIIFLFLLFNINIYLGYITVILSIIYFLSEATINKKIIIKLNNYLIEEDQVNSILYEYLSSMNTIKSLHLEKDKTNSFFKKYQIFLEKAYIVNRVSLFDTTISNIINDSFIILAISIGSILVIKNKFNVGSIIVFTNILNYYLTAYLNIISLYKDYSKYKLAKNRIEDLFTIKIENFNCLEYFLDVKSLTNIKISNLTYSYSYKNILDNLSLNIKKKDKILIKGPSGIGKSTLMKILCRFINIDYGYIKINNIDLTHFHLDTIRRKITYVSQQENLFTGTVYENVIQNNSEKNFHEICKLTKLDEIVDKQLGYKQLVEEGGSNFSGGERQRIILARSLMKDSDIYIFDESLNQLDPKKESEILKNIINYLNEKIVIVVSHRVTTDNYFNRVLTLKNGKIYEEI